MELIVFDLDGTLLNAEAAISEYTRDTLRLLASHDVAYTVATGRTLHASRAVLEGHGFHLPQIYKNGVMIWHPASGRFTHQNALTRDESTHVIEACIDAGVAPFVFTLEGDEDHSVYHAPLTSDIERRLAADYGLNRGLKVAGLDALPATADISNISAIGRPEAVAAAMQRIAPHRHLVAYSGVAYEDDELDWLDIHHSDASKGGAIEVLRDLMGIERIICFGDSDNDLSMFDLADESYAPANAKPSVKAAATAVIGHHDEEGIARFLRERFDLPGD